MKKFIGVIFLVILANAILQAPAEISTLQLQNLTFAGAGQKSNSQLNIGLNLGVAYRL